jgi:L-ascorbate metabolism protein UlaG (beta-lactamase superfamily)
MTDILHFRWLGTAGVEFEFAGERVLVDPYLSRFPIWNTLFGRPAPRRELIKKYLRPAHAILVSHSHYDHLIDVPEICREFRATVFGSANTSAILAAYGISPALSRTVSAGDSFAAADFKITVFPGRHGRMLGGLPFTGPLPARLTPPLRLSDFRMDTMLSFHLTAGGHSFLVWNDPEPTGAPPADVLFYCPLWGAQAAARVAHATQARWMVPVHWEDMFIPLDRPPRPMIVPPGWHSPWIRRMDPRSFTTALHEEIPGPQVIVPAPFVTLDLPW